MVRNPGDGQQRDEDSKDNKGAAARIANNLVHIELTPYEAGKPGFTGNRPLLGKPVKDISFAYFKGCFPFQRLQQAQVW